VGVSLDTITPSRETAQRRLAAVSRHIADARIKAVSGEARFCSAYTAIQQAEALYSFALGWLKKNKKDLL
jgi:hypothetical protein